MAGPDALKDCVNPVVSEGPEYAGKFSDTNAAALEKLGHVTYMASWTRF